MGESIYLTLGSYEGHLVGYRVSDAALSADGDPEERRAAAPTAFALRAHDGCVRAIASGGAYLATCGTDHAISVYNIRKLREQGKLLQQEGGTSLHCLAFFADSHLLSGGGDGELCIWRASDWECLLRMKGHKGAVHALAIHPSGRAALSVAADSKLMLWNLTTGKCNYTAALAEPAHLIAWSPDGEAYVHDTRRSLLVHDLRTGQLLNALTHDEAPPLALAYAGDAMLLSGDDAGTLRVWDTVRGECVCAEKRAHSHRIKAIAVIRPAADISATATSGSTCRFTFATASSNGTVTVWSLIQPAADAVKAAQVARQIHRRQLATPTEDAAAVLHSLFSIETRLRLTTLAATMPTRSTKPPLQSETAERPGASKAAGNGQRETAVHPRGSDIAEGEDEKTLGEVDERDGQKEVKRRKLKKQGRAE